MLGISTEICIKRNHSWVLDQARIEGLITVVFSLETWNEMHFYRQPRTFGGLFPGFRCEHLIRNFPTSAALADVKVELLFMFLEDKRNYCTLKWITCIFNKSPVLLNGTFAPLDRTLYFIHW